MHILSEKGRVRKRHAALTLFEVAVVVAVLAFVSLLTVSSAMQMREKRARLGCVNNLKVIGTGLRVWSGDHSDLLPVQVLFTNGDFAKLGPADVARCFAMMLKEAGGDPKIFHCPADAKRTFATNTADFTSSRISYFVGPGASDTYPQSLLSGDRNITNASGVTAGVLVLRTNTPAGWTQEIHKGYGNLLIGDGSVQQASSARLADYNAEKTVLLLP